MNNTKKIYFLGPQGSYTQIAANKFVDQLSLQGTLEPVSTIARVVSELVQNPDMLAVVPIENSIEGIVRETIDNILNIEDGLNILCQCYIPIQHCLISKGKFEEIKNIVSHPQALSQCQNYICKNFSTDINIVSASSTSQGVQSLLGRDESWGAIGNELCAEHYELNIVAKNINDVADNKTRFVLIGRGAAQKQERTSMAFSTKNEPGALLRVLEIFKKHELNMVYLESRPSKKVFGEYVFYVDIDCGADKIKEALVNIERYCNFYKLLGSYSVI